MIRRHVPTNVFGYIISASALISVVAVILSIMALNSSVKQQTTQSARDARQQRIEATRDAQQAAVIAAAKATQAATHESICRFYSFTIGSPNAPARSTSFGLYQLKEAKKAFRKEGCSLAAANPSSWLGPSYTLLPTTQASTPGPTR